MKFTLVEGRTSNFEEIKDDFQRDYLQSNLKNNEIKLKYGLTHNEFKALANEVKSEAGLNHRNGRKGKGKFYYKCARGFSIQRRINGNNTYFGCVPTIELAKQAIAICEELQWQVQECRLAIWELKLCC